METLTSHTVDFQLVSNLILVEAELNGRIKTLVFDTGASHTVVERKVANDLGLAKTDQTEPTKGCMAFGEAQMTELKSLNVGGAVANDISVASIELNDLFEKIGHPIGGILGYNFLSQFLISIDYEKQQLTFTPVGSSQN